ncbi:molybdate ABC transporter substrate-binding protein [Chengkuizengella axinellae]|uniref:Molybdate ABC transporter substrate-binding protein n=1 Tax=Chengkuizengella axinellae TaxID=3064388 RepID=A0ABT9IV21_9BACL|nr:molybdate ABC transporter substrate-binding protein [Chengkuizengella sp. 2205SS18-9]MDP5272670.1 molybdate ABC transporter substrate-binding protein [Chengkuizengella sp. 2205SS18-9]
MLFTTKNVILKISICLFVIFLLSACSLQNDRKHSVTELHISAASSLTNALNEIKNEFEKIHPDIKIIYNFGASGTLASQLKQGAPADVFFSANKKYMDELAALGLIETNDIVNLLSNQIVLITHQNSDLYLQSLDDLLKAEFASIASGEPSVVPAGSYTKQLLIEKELWYELESKVVFTTNVRQALNYTETGNVDAAFVYKSDALKSNHSKIIYESDPNLHEPIIYPVGITIDSKNHGYASTFISFLQEKDSQTIFEEYGLTNYSEPVRSSL